MKTSMEQELGDINLNYGAAETTQDIKASELEKSQWLTSLLPRCRTWNQYLEARTLPTNVKILRVVSRHLLFESL